jgi:hypothetical protein
MLRFPGKGNRLDTISKFSSWASPQLLRIRNNLAGVLRA